MPAVPLLVLFPLPAGGFESENHKAAFLRSIEGHSNLRYHGVVGGERKKSLFHLPKEIPLPEIPPVLDPDAG